jgi:hypothetical protein
VSARRLEHMADAFVALAQTHDYYPEEPEWKISNVCACAVKLIDLADDLYDQRRELVRLLWRQRRINRRLRLLLAALEVEP